MNCSPGDYKERLTKYGTQEEIFGSRNSFSKIDTDATFMRMKNGQLKVGYNVQIATENQFVLHAQVYQNPIDLRTLSPFINSYETELGSLPENICADAGHGSEQN